MQKIVAVFVTAIACFISLLFIFSGCSKQQDSKSSAKSTSVSQQATQTLSEQTTEPTTNGSEDVEIDFSDLQ